MLHRSGEEDRATAIVHDEIEKRMIRSEIDSLRVGNNHTFGIEDRGGGGGFGAFLGNLDEGLVKDIGNTQSFVVGHPSEIGSGGERALHAEGGEIRNQLKTLLGREAWQLEMHRGVTKFRQQRVKG